MPNVEAIRETLEYIRAHPEEHDPEHWARKPGGVNCGTTRCMAGTAVHLSPEHQIIWQPGSTESEYCVNRFGGEVQRIEKVAGELLGLKWDQADHMFYDTDSLRDLYEYAHTVTDGAIEVPAVLPGDGVDVVITNA